MKFSSIVGTSAGLAVSLFVATAPAIATTYTVSRTIGPSTLNGTISTNNAIGVLATDDITGFNLTITEGGLTRTITYSGPGSVFVNGSSLTASSSGLFFDFDNAAPSFAFFKNAGGTQTFYCLQTAQCFNPQAPSEGFDTEYSATVGAIAARSGNVQFASVAAGAPEPATWGIMTLGFGAAGVAMRRRSRPRTTKVTGGKIVLT